MSTLNTNITSWRSGAGKATGAQGWLAKLNIDGKLYQIKDPAVEQLATQLDTEFTGVQNKLEGIQGQILNAQSSWTEVTNSAANNKIITSLTQSTTGAISYSVADLEAANVKSTAVTADATHIGVTSTNVDGAIAELAAGVQSVAGDAAGVQAQLEALAGSGYDWAGSANKIQNIINELNDAAAQGGIQGTVIDAFTTKLAGIQSGVQTTVGTLDTDGSVKDYVDKTAAALQEQVTSVSVTATGETGNNALIDAWTTNSGRTVNVGAQGRLLSAVEAAESSLQTISSETTALLGVQTKSGNAGSQTSAIYATAKLTDAVGAAETALQEIDGDTYIAVSAKTNGVQSISATTDLTNAISAANNALPSSYVAKGTQTIAGFQTAEYTYADEELTITHGTSDSYTINAVEYTANWS